MLSNRMKRTNKALVLSLFLSLALMVAACQPAETQPGTPPAIAETPAAPGLPETGVTPPAGDQAAEVNIVDSEFQAEELTIPAGTTVTWTHNGSLPHTVTADDGAFDSGTLQTGDTFQHTFNEPGSYPYHCELHGAAGGTGMAGVIVVEGQ